MCRNQVQSPATLRREQQACQKRRLSNQRDDAFDYFLRPLPADVTK